MSRRAVVSGVTLLVLLVVLGGMAVYGFRAATAPLPSAQDLGPDECSAEELQVQRFVTRGDVEVSVYNAGSASGLAGRTMDQLEDAGFVPGSIGNAPEGTEVRRAVVWTTQPDDLSAQLVALSLGPDTRVEVVADELGPGVDVIVGNRLRGLDPNAADRLELPEPVEVCVRVE